MAEELELEYVVFFLHPPSYIYGRERCIQTNLTSLIEVKYELHW